MSSASTYYANYPSTTNNKRRVSKYVIFKKFHLNDLKTNKFKNVLLICNKQIHFIWYASYYPTINISVPITSCRKNSNLQPKKKI